MKIDKFKKLLPKIAYLLTFSAFSVFSAEDEGPFGVDDIISRPSSVYVCIFDATNVVIAQKRTCASWHVEEMPIGDLKEVNGKQYRVLPKHRFPEEKFPPQGSAIGNNPGQLVLPGGRSQVGETLWVAAQREFSEETSYDIGTFREDPPAHISGHRFKSGRTNYYALYIDVRDLPDEDPRRGVSLYEPGQIIFDNFNDLVRGKIACRDAINTHGEFPQEGPSVDSDELEHVMGYMAEEVIPQFRYDRRPKYDQSWFRIIIERQFLPTL